MRPYILGLNNPQGNEPLDPREPGTAGYRLWRMTTEVCGITMERWRNNTQRVNLLGYKVLPSDYRAIAAHRAEYIRGFVSKRLVIILGKDVANAMRHEAPPFEWVGSHVMIPHPSGKNLFYNEHVHRVAVGQLLGDALAACDVELSWKPTTNLEESASESV